MPAKVRQPSAPVPVPVPPRPPAPKPANAPPLTRPAKAPSPPPAFAPAVLSPVLADDDGVEENGRRRRGESSDSLRQREGVRAGCARLGRRFVRDALRHILHPENPADRTEDIHQVRVQCKRLRALLRLLKPVCDANRITEENARLRDAAQALSAYRDAFVASETLKRVFDDTGPRRVGDAFVLLGVKAGGTKPRRNLQAAFDTLAAALRQAGAALRALAPAARGWESLAPGLERSFRRARESCRKCAKRRHKHGAECFHEWRKRVKDLTYQLEFLDNVEPAMVRQLRKSFRRLGTLLGDDHDLVVFADHVQKRERLFEHLATFHPVQKRLRHRLKALREHEFALAAPLFADEPEVWVAKLANLWQRWKNPRLAATGPVALEMTFAGVGEAKAKPPGTEQAKASKVKASAAQPERGSQPKN